MIEKSERFWSAMCGVLIALLLAVAFLLPDDAFAAVVLSQYSGSAQNIQAAYVGTVGIMVNCDSVPIVVDSIAVKGTGNGANNFPASFFFGDSQTDVQWFPPFAAGVATRTFTFSPAVTCAEGSGNFYLQGVSTTSGNRLGYLVGSASEVSTPTECVSGGGYDAVNGSGDCQENVVADWVFEIQGSAYSPPDPPSSSSSTTTLESGVAILTVGLPMIAIAVFWLVYSLITA